MTCTQTVLEQSEVAYHKLQEIQKKLEEIEEDTKTLFEYGPFRFASDFEYKMRATRHDLILKCVEALRARVVPMAKLEDGFDFVKLMNFAVGNEVDFNAYTLQDYFDRLEADHAGVQKLSLRTNMQRVRKFLPYSNASGMWGATKNAEDLIESGNALVLKSYSWRVDRLSWDLNSDREFNALHKAIEIALFDMDPATVEKYTQMTDHVMKKKTPEEFYQTIQGFDNGHCISNHPAISRFRFFKNGTLKIWFKNHDQALRVAKFLVGGQPE
jgi:hypothetical protein